MSILGVSLPICLPIGETAAELEPYQDNLADKISYMITKAHTAVCYMNESKLVTFNNNKLTLEVPQSCFQMLAQDCTPKLKFIVMLKRDLEKRQNQIYIKIYNLSGLHEVYLDTKTLRVRVVDWMRGFTCGLCGKGDGEMRQDFQTPNQRQVDNAVSFAHSWVVPAKSCKDASDCYMRLESVKLEKQVILHGQASKCFSVEPVLRCLPGCDAVRTTIVDVGYHCLPADSNVSRGQLSTIYEKSIDIREKAVAHLACRFLLTVTVQGQFLTQSVQTTEHAADCKQIRQPADWLDRCLATKHSLSQRGAPHNIHPDSLSLVLLEKSAGYRIKIKRKLKV
ncbi:Vitellogenin-2 [Liparis tanakae]|uniref:Vitellogenin-2 n=1 Tax=Liparis tanakae TaxID=230148 RepID=A0A4Z2HU86_9TELE|nr:Vitellogenin-2 [Liparis tanakae]